MLFCNSAPVKKNIKLSKVLYRGKKSQLHPDLNLLSLFSITLNCWTIVQLFDKYISKSSYSIFKKEKKTADVCALSDRGNTATVREVFMNECYTHWLFFLSYHGKKSYYTCSNSKRIMN